MYRRMTAPPIDESKSRAFSPTKENKEDTREQKSPEKKKDPSVVIAPSGGLEPDVVARPPKGI